MLTDSRTRGLWLCVRQQGRLLGSSCESGCRNTSQPTPPPLRGRVKGYTFLKLLVCFARAPVFGGAHRRCSRPRRAWCRSVRGSPWARAMPPTPRWASGRCAARRRTPAGAPTGASWGRQ
eukprot:1179817-Prorocentrum_minimum.AAC.1